MSQIDFPTRPLLLMGRQADKTLNFLERKCGVVCKVWKPRQIDATYQEFDDSLGHEETPYYEGRLILPFMFAMHPKGSEQMYSGLEDEQYMFARSDLKLFRNSLVQPQWSMTLEKEILLRIDMIEAIGMTGVWQKATLVNAANRQSVPQDLDYIEEVSEVPTVDVNPYPPQEFDQLS